MAAPASRPSNTALRLSRKWHEWLGLGTALLLCLSALTGLYLNHKDLFSGGPDPAARPKPAKAPQALALGTGEAAFTPAPALALAESKWGQAPLEHIHLKQEGRGLVWRLKATDGRELHVDATDGRVLFDRGPKTNNGLNKLITDLHTGQIANLPGRLAMDAGALGLLILTGTGLYVWILPRLRRRRAKA